MDVENMYSNNNQSRAVNWRWRVEGDITEMPRALRQTGYNYLGSDRFVEDGSIHTAVNPKHRTTWPKPSTLSRLRNVIRAPLVAKW